LSGIFGLMIGVWLVGGVFVILGAAAVVLNGR
jgi:hypothetical protein